MQGLKHDSIKGKYIIHRSDRTQKIKTWSDENCFCVCFTNTSLLPGSQGCSHHLLSCHCDLWPWASFLLVVWEAGDRGAEAHSAAVSHSAVCNLLSQQFDCLFIILVRVMSYFLTNPIKILLVADSSLSVKIAWCEISLQLLAILW